MSPTTLLTSGGIFFIIGVVFHLGFWKIFDWKNSLKKAGFVNRQVIQILNICLTSVFALFAYLSLFLQADMLKSRIGNLLIIFIVVFLIGRLILQFIYFPLKNRNSQFFSAVVFIGILIYGHLSWTILF